MTGHQPVQTNKHGSVWKLGIPLCRNPRVFHNFSLGDDSLIKNSYTIWLFNSLPWKITILIGKPSINGPFSMAMLNNQRVDDSPNCQFY